MVKVHPYYTIKISVYGTDDIYIYIYIYIYTYINSKYTMQLKPLAIEHLKPVNSLRTSGVVNPVRSQECT
jgi:hypothetical protein